MQLRFHSVQWVIGSIVLFFGVMLWIPPFFFVHDQVLLGKLSTGLEQSLAGNGLKINIRQVHWERWNRIVAHEIQISDADDRRVPLSFQKLVIKVNLFSLLQNLHQPESALQEVELVNPRFQLEHYQDGSWNWQRYFSGHGKRKMHFDMVIRMADATLQMHDTRYGYYLFHQVNGTVNFKNFPVVRWNLQGKLGRAESLSWAAQGEMDSEKIIGRTTVDFNHALLEKFRPFWPTRLPYQIRSGCASGSVRLAWTKNGVWVEDGKTSVRDAILNVSWLTNPVTVKKLHADFSPEQITVERSEMIYQRSTLNFSGLVRPQTAAITGDLKVRGLDVTDLAGIIPTIKEHQVSGKVDINLHVNGTVSRPVLDGNVTLEKGRFAVADRNIQNINGRFILSGNNLKVKRLTGNYQKTSFAVSGEVRNILKPQYHLQIHASPLDLGEFQPQLVKAGITIDDATEFTGEITGNWRRPVLAGTVALNRLAYQEYVLDHPALKFVWSIPSGTFKVVNCTGNINSGRFEVKGKVAITSKKAAWDLTGELSRIDLVAIPSLRNSGLDGTISTNVVIRGEWEKGNAFNPGSVFGVLDGKNLVFKELSVDTVRAVYTWQDGRLQIDSFQGNAGQGRIFGSLMWNGSGLLANMSVENVRLGNILNRSSQYAVDGIVKGNLSLEGPIDNLKGKIIGRCERAQWLSHELGNIDGELVYTNRRFDISELDVSGPTGDYTVRGSFGLEPNSTLNLDLTGSAINLNVLAGWFPAGKRMGFDGEGNIHLMVEGSLIAPKYKGTLDLSKPRIKNLVMNYGHAEFEGDLQTIRVNEFSLGNDHGSIRIYGVADREKLNLEYNGHLDEIEQLGINYGGNTARGAVDLKGKIAGNFEKPQVTAEIHGERIEFGNFKNQSLAGMMVLKYPYVRIWSLRLTGSDGNLEFNGRINLKQLAQLDLLMKANGISVKTLLTTFKVHNVATDGKLTGLAEFKGTLTNPVIKAEGFFTDGFINQLPVNGHFQMEYSHNNLQIQKVELKHGSGSLLANGVWENGNTLRLTASLSNFPLQTLDLLIPFKSEVSGTTNAEIRLEWSKSGVFGEYRCEIMNLGIHQNHLGDLYAQGSYTETGVTLSNSTLATSGGNLMLNGYLPWPVKFVQTLNLPVHQNLSRNIALRMVAQEIPVEVFNFIPESFSLAKGRLNGNLQLNGTFENPVISGKVECKNAQLNLPNLPLLAENIQLVLSITANRVDVQKASGTIQKGTFSITGRAQLEKLLPATYSLAVSGSKIYYKNSFFDGYGNLNVDITGAFSKMLIAGDITVNNCRIGISGGNRSHKGQHFWTPELDLKIKAGKNVRYRQIGIADVGVSGEITVKGDGYQPKLEGKVFSEKGVLTIYGQNFIVQRGLAVFRPENGAQPYLEVDSNYRTPKAEIFLTVRGQVGAGLTVNLSSQPYLSREEIYTLLNWSLLNGEEPLTVDGMIGSNLSFVTDSLFGDVFNGVRNSLHLDYLYLETNYTENEFRINMGDYITDELFLSYSRSIVSGDPQETWGLDYHLTPKLKLGGTYSIEDQMLWKLTYGFRF